MLTVIKERSFAGKKIDSNILPRQTLLNLNSTRQKENAQSQNEFKINQFLRRDQKPQIISKKKLNQGS